MLLLENGYSKPKCHNLHNVQLVFVSVQKNAQTSFCIFLQPRKMLDFAKFSSPDSGSHLRSRLLKMFDVRKIQIL